MFGVRNQFQVAVNLRGFAAVFARDVTDFKFTETQIKINPYSNHVNGAGIHSRLKRNLGSAAINAPQSNTQSI